MSRSKHFLIDAVLVTAVILAATRPSRAEPTNRIVARVNDRIATLYDYEARFEDALRRERDVPSEPAEREDFVRGVARDTMRDLFEELLVLSRADQLDITVTADEVTQSVNRMRKANQLEDDKQFEEAIAQSGISTEMLRSQFESQIRFQKVIGREVYSQIQLEEEDLRRYYKDHVDEFRTPAEVKLREVVVLDDTGVSPVAATTADALAATIQGGKSLEEAVAALPEGTVSSVIQLGWVEQGDLDAALEKAAWTLAPGAWSAPTRARGGVHLVQVIERREPTVPAFKDVEAKIRQREERAAMNERMKGYLDDLGKKSYLFLDPPAQAAGFRGAEADTANGVEFPFVDPSETTEAAGKGKGGKGSKGGEKAAPGKVDDAAVAAAAAEEVREQAAEEEKIEKDTEDIEEWPPKPQTGQPADVTPPPEAPAAPAPPPPASP